MYSPLLSSVFPSVCFYSEAMVVSKMAAGFSELQQRKVGFLALYDVRVGVFEFVFFVKLQNSCYLGKENPLCVLYLSWGLQDPRQTKQLPIWWHLFSGFYILLDISWGKCLILCLIVFFFFSILEVPMRWLCCCCELFPVPCFWEKATTLPSFSRLINQS